MDVELLYEGLKLGSAVSRQEGDGLFVEFPEPLPVGTLLTLMDVRGPRPLEVARVVETQPAGMWLKESTRQVDGPPIQETPAKPSREQAIEALAAPKTPSTEGSGVRKGRRRSKTFTGR